MYTASSFKDKNASKRVREEQLKQKEAEDRMKKALSDAGTVSFLSFFLSIF